MQLKVLSVSIVIRTAMTIQIYDLSFLSTGVLCCVCSSRCSLLNSSNVDVFR